VNRFRHRVSEPHLVEKAHAIGKASRIHTRGGRSPRRRSGHDRGDRGCGTGYDPATNIPGGSVARVR
jgi:hypothetical protein